MRGFTIAAWVLCAATGLASCTDLTNLLEDCAGNELACGDNTGDDTVSTVVHRFTAGDRVLAVVDGKVGSAGNAVLNASPITCPGQELSGQPLPVQLSTIGGPDIQVGDCSSQGLPERSYRWTPPSDGLYRFGARSDCGGEEVFCARSTDDSSGKANAKWGYFTRDNGDYTVVVESPQMLDLDYQLSGRCNL